MHSQEPRIGFYDSHHMPSGIAPVLLQFREGGIPMDEADCLCQGESYLNRMTLPPIAVVHPSYDEPSCPQAIGRIARAHPNTRFILPVLTFIGPTVDRVIEDVGQLENVEVLRLENYADRLHGLFNELKSSLSQ